MTNKQTYTFNRDGQSEVVQREDWRWEAHYLDGTVLEQFGQDGVFHQFAEIDQSQLQLFRMVHDTLPPFTLMFKADSMKLIHFYRRVVLDYMSPNPQKITIYFFGYEQSGQKFTVGLTPHEAVVTDDPNILAVG